MSLSSDKIQKAAQRYWRRLTEPVNTVQFREQRRLSRLMAGSLIVAFMINLLLFAMRISASVSSQAELIVRVVLSILLVTMYVLARRGYYREAAWLAVVNCTLLLFALAFVQGDAARHPLNYLAVVVIFSSLFLTIPMTVMIVVTHLIGLLLFPLLTPTITLVEIVAGPLSLNLVLALFVLLVMRYRKVLETEGRADLEESETNLQKAQEIAQLGSYTWNIQTSEVQWSNTLKTILGSELEEPSYDLFLDKIYPDDRERVLREVEQAQKQSENFNSEYRILRTDGSIRYVRDIAEVEYDASGKPLHMFGTSLDITTLKETEIALRESEARLRSILRVAPVGIGLVSERILLQANDQLCAMTGYTSEELIGQSARILYPTDEEYEFVGREKYDQIQARGTGTVETSWQRKDGQIIDVLLSSTPLNTADLTVGVTFTALDITERKHAEQALRQSEARFRLAFQTSPDSININRAEDGLFVEINQGFTTIMGYTRDDVHGKTTRELNIWKREADREKLVEGLKNQGAVSNLETEFITKNGSSRIGLMSASIIQLNDVPHIISITRDITERKHMEDELRRHQNQLEDLVQERTQSLSEANAQLKVLSQVKDEFVSNVSHELRTPIASLKLRTFLLEKNPELLAKYLPVMQRETNRLHHTIEDLLQLSRLDQFKTMWSPRSLDLNLIVAQFTSDRTLLAEEEDITLNLTIEEKLPLVMGDEGLIVQALSVLVTNALSYTPTGGSIAIKTQTGSFAGQTWAGFSVSDTGPGIPPEEQEHLFERFFRGKTAVKSGKRGTGLGLAIAKEIVDRHHGKIEVVSTGKPGEGATFTVWLPALKES